MLSGQFRWELVEVEHSHNPSTPEAEAGGLRVKTSLGYILNAYLQGEGGKEWEWVGAVRARSEASQGCG